jgi:hypothetical protein
VEELGNMIETVLEITGLWAIVSSLMIVSKHFSRKPASILLTQPLKRHKSDLKLGLQ